MARQAKALQKKSKTHEVKNAGNGKFIVTSGATGAQYTVTLLGNAQATCTCPWAEKRGLEGKPVACSHTVAAFDHIDETRRVSAWESKEKARKQHRPIIDLGDGLILTSRLVAA